jgi:MFS family permease
VLILLVRIVGARIPDRLGGRVAGALALGFSATGIAIAAAWPSVAGLLVGTVVLAAGMSLMYPALLLLSLAGVPDTERASVVATFSSFFDASQGVGAFICGAVAAFSGERGAFAAGAIAAFAGLALLLRSRPASTRGPGAEALPA